MKEERRTSEALQAASVAISKKDFTLWGVPAGQVARDRLGWIDLPENSRELLPTLDALAAWSRSLKRDRFVLAGMGGSSLAPAVIAATHQRELVLLDSTHPDDIKSILDPDPQSTIFVLSSKSGTTIETLSHLKAIEERLSRAQLPLSEHLLVITDPGSPLAEWASAREVRFFLGEPTVGGRFSALSIFGLLPAALLGVDCATLLDDAADMQTALTSSEGENLAVSLTQEILDAQPFLELPATPLSDWVEQLIAESTGKLGVGIIPVLSDHAHLGAISEKALTLPLGAAFYLWEWCTALLGYALEVNPFDQPDVASAKVATATALAADALLDGSVIRTSENLLAQIARTFTDQEEYLALLCFLPMHDAKLRLLMDQIRKSLQRNQKLSGNKERKVTLGFGPRYLHSTGQCHKGGPAIGGFLIITLDRAGDYSIPGERYSFGRLITAQALGDLHTLKSLGRKILHAHMTYEEIEKVSRALHGAS